MIKANPLIIHIKDAVVIKKERLTDYDFHIVHLLKVLIRQGLNHYFAAELRIVFLQKVLLLHNFQLCAILESDLERLKARRRAASLVVADRTQLVSIATQRHTVNAI